ncbi:MAG: hypothetical protein A3F14_04255 [Gammaproteobacteria bacterium RIFCSPHIGHO2_12_FULL_43_28]|nr:MAG: hypothetical protein A3F14_04255 [Gammaproteobacteria bacterium RIFCSPHIGHO2_12_FULL_43_28]
MRYLITGGSGYFGGELKRSLLNDGHTCVNVDLAHDHDQHPFLTAITADISQNGSLEKIFAQHGPFDCVFHAAAQLQFKWRNRRLFYATNVDATRTLAENCIKHQVKNLVFISSNCVYGRINGTEITEETPLDPFEVYGQTKVASEAILQTYRGQLNSVILRPPTIIGEGRLGILSIVFDFIKENRKLWLVGSGENRYQFIYSHDLINACKKAAHYPTTAVFNIGSDAVPSLNQLFQRLITHAKSQTKIRHLPTAWTVPAMKLAFKLNLSPLGPYQYNMIANTFVGDTRKIKSVLQWQPTKSNTDMLIDNYHYYLNHYAEIHANQTLNGHRRAGKPGILALIKWLS